MALEHASLTNIETGERFEVLFNPAEYSLSKEIVFAQAAVPGRASPLLQFVHGNTRTLDMELFFDTWEAHNRAGGPAVAAGTDVRELTQKVTGLMSLDPKTQAPPGVLFAWGSLTFTGVLVRANERFTMFLESGIPVRAQMQVSFNEWQPADEQPRETGPQTAAFTHRHVVGQAQTLSSIAAAIYGDPAKWRPIAIASDLPDPRRLPAGLVLDVPRLPFRDPQSGEVLA
jgi:hypothetical protein